MAPKQSKKEMREYLVLIGLIDLYLEMGKPIGSSTLREHGFQHLSSATIRNYFAELERAGLLKQPHASGGRIPTEEAFRLYAEDSLSQPFLTPNAEEALQPFADIESPNLLRYLQQAGEKLSEVTGCAIFLSSLRFDHDFILDIKLVGIDQERVLCVIITDFGQILTEVLPVEQKFSSFALKRIEGYVQWRVKGGERPPENLSIEEKSIAQGFYNELMVRYLVRYSNFSEEDVYRTGFSRLLGFPEFNDPLSLATGLALFESTEKMRLLLNDSARKETLHFWIGNDLIPYASAAQGCSVIAIPYRIGTSIAGAVGILGPYRMPYRAFFGALRFFSECVSKSLTKSLLKFKLSFRQPHSGSPYLQHDQTSLKFLEKKE